MRTVLHGQRMHRYAFDQGEVPATQRAAELDAGWSAAYEELCGLLEGNERALQLLNSLLPLGPGEAEAMGGETSSPARPTVFEPATDQPPAFPGRPFRSSRGTDMEPNNASMSKLARPAARDATYTPMATGRDVQPNSAGRLTMPRVAADGLLRWETDEAEIRRRLAVSDMRREAKARERLESRFPGFSRLGRAF
jgi:hypothetical protein